ncbi:MAG: RraA family protein [Albidovulum sp.]|nr:RraA family protein [Albidovulum sp.]
MEKDLFETLREIDTPTVCNAIEVALGARGHYFYSRGPVATTGFGGKPIVGRALTAKIRASEPFEGSADQARGRRMAYYKYMAEGVRPGIAVLEDLDKPNICGAYWGEVNATVHKAFGIAGVVTDGLVRDLGELPDGFPIVAAEIGVSHAFVHVVEIDTPVSVFGMEVNPGDLIHADIHGAVVVPREAEPKLAAAVAEMIETESIVLGPARNADGYDFETFRKSWEAFENRRK